MAEMTLTKARILAGVWEGELTVTGGSSLPEIEVSHLAKPLLGASVEPLPDQASRYLVRMPIPSELLSEGVQTFVIGDKASGEKLSHFSVVVGQPLDDDVLAEMDLLRAELDMLKRAFRKHCLETA
ncbi:hypothetical protein K3X44_12200 [Aliiroseovarius crassostreae]|uniref:hypothetical protein n=1 Tax=Aliiroseovarius crassostreae TaxID=154981 RepID=UPI0021F98FDF|nr:hypothetical protein [Aliiroseovarius crassostreae]UWQ01246.1 hypothetical protein K3X44_12200 [Aliiroseovarius crassostreae]